jgi:hypothetical protein
MKIKNNTIIIIIMKLITSLYAHKHSLDLFYVVS